MSSVHFPPYHVDGAQYWRDDNQPRQTVIRRSARGGLVSVRQEPTSLKDPVIDECNHVFEKSYLYGLPRVKDSDGSVNRNDVTCPISGDRICLATLRSALERQPSARHLPGVDDKGVVSSSSSSFSSSSSSSYMSSSSASSVVSSSAPSSGSIPSGDLNSILQGFKEMREEYTLMKTQYIALQISFNEMAESNKKLKETCETLKKERDLEKCKYNTLESNYRTLDSNYRTLELSHRTLESSHRTLEPRITAKLESRITEVNTKIKIAQKQVNNFIEMSVGDRVRSVFNPSYLSTVRDRGLTYVEKNMVNS